MPRYHFPADRPAPVPVPRVNGADCLSMLESDFPRVIEAILAQWGYKELNEYFRKLMIDDRGNRLGFPPQAWEEIYLLQHIHLEFMPDSAL